LLFNRKKYDIHIGILFKFACVTDSFKEVLDRKKVINALSNILNTQGYSISLKLNVIRVISTLVMQEGKEDVLTYLLKAEDERFFRNFGKLVKDNHVITI